MKKVLAFDFGASSGRAILGTFNGSSIQIQEVHRFSNDPVEINGTLYWDALRLFFEIKQGISKAVLEGGDFDAIGIDTWGVDFGLIGKDGQLLANPVHYRDDRNARAMEEFFTEFDREWLYTETGIQILAFNTVFQLYHLKKHQPELLAQADKLLFMPDLFRYFLTGVAASEYTIASTGALLDPEKRDWSESLFAKADLPKDILCPVTQPGDCSAVLSEKICAELGAKPVPVIPVASHDTASAVVAVPAKEKDFIYISCGTWSLFGCEELSPRVDAASREANFTNEGGYGGTIRYLKNIMGLWLIQESRRQWQREGQQVTFADLERDALAVPAFRSFIDPDAPDFVAPGNLPRRVAAYCERTGQPVPQTRGEIMRCIYESLAMKYRLTYEFIEELTGRKYASIHMVGGGTKDNFLCQLAATACNIPVVAGPIEATALGNIAVQLMALGEIPDLWEARKVISNSFDPITYAPADRAGWDEAFERFKAVIGK
ncbi:MAG: rhamnulokinase [Oscillospiraceae bacterium]|nr:rhamnulokinase [Oscillospiraceae bacterium]